MNLLDKAKQAEIERALNGIPELKKIQQKVMVNTNEKAFYVEDLDYLADVCERIKEWIVETETVQCDWAIGDYFELHHLGEKYLVPNEFFGIELSPHFKIKMEKLEQKRIAHIIQSFLTIHSRDKESIARKLGMTLDMFNESIDASNAQLREFSIKLADSMHWQPFLFLYPGVAEGIAQTKVSRLLNGKEVDKYVHDEKTRELVKSHIANTQTINAEAEELRRKLDHLTKKKEENVKALVKLLMLDNLPRPEITT